MWFYGLAFAWSQGLIEVPGNLFTSRRPTKSSPRPEFPQFARVYNRAVRYPRLARLISIARQTRSSLEVL